MLGFFNAVYRFEIHLLSRLLQESMPALIIENRVTLETNVRMKAFLKLDVVRCSLSSHWKGI